MFHKSVRFGRTAKSDFIHTLRGRVSEYFVENRLSKNANTTMIVKTIIMFTLLFGPWLVLIFGVITNPWAVIGLYIVMAMGKCGVGFSVMHDACHGSYSRNALVNRFLGYSMNLIGGNSRNWKIQHNVLHHSFTNVEGLDEDIAPPAILLRFSPHAKRYKIHALQHIYGWFLYALETLMWCTTKDFTGLVKYHREGLLRKEDGSFVLLITKTFIWKLVYFGYILVLPMIFSPVAWWVVLLGFVAMHLVTGLLIAIVFQAAHVMPHMEFPLPDQDGNLENDWAVHQILTTTNFSPKSRAFSWFVGGLNYQIEHHLFPNICHVHYPKIARIVRETAQEFGLPYQSRKYFVQALADHARMLRNLGRYDVLPA